MIGNAAGLAGGAQGNSSNLQLATVTAVGAVVTAQIDGSSATFTLITDVDRTRANPATVGDRVLCTLQGSSMYEIALVSSAYPALKMLSGSTAAVITAATSALVTIAFPAGFFTARPTVMAIPRGSGAFFAALPATGDTVSQLVRVQNYLNNVTTVTLAVDWIAYGV